MKTNKGIRKSWPERVAGRARRFSKTVIVRGYPTGRSSAHSKTAGLVLLFALLAVAAAPAVAAVYKWVDRNGVTQYSSTPPPDGKVTKLHIRPAPPRKVIDAAAQRLEQHLEESKESDVEDKAAARRQAEEATTLQEVAARNCHIAKEDLYRLRLQKPVFYLNEKGERVYIEDKERASRIQKLQEEAAANCNGFQ